MSVNASPNSTVNLTCEATDVSFIHLLVNGKTIAELSGFSNFSYTLFTINETKVFSVSFLAEVKYNNTNISCVGEPGRINSTNALLMIQGTLIN